ncbi:MAG: acetate--CoA ligase family protein [Ignavibacteriales bacterium]|nr:acetate--CoA ligase family protein [Ignavibacteriales bacterium]
MNSNLKNFFYPKSICVAGASTKEKSIGYELLKTILTYGYKGKVFPVNPKADEILGLKCYQTISSINEEIDMAIILVPKSIVEQTLDELLSKNVKSIILITAGFKETGREGEQIEKNILEKVKVAGASLVGPNCMGVINTSADVKLNATFVAEKPEFGKVGFLSQSGALGAAVLNSLRDTDIKFAHFISVGNKVDVNENDIIDFWQKDNNIQILALYLESFVDGKEFIQNFYERKITKSTIVLKAGRTLEGMKAASSHTGALGSSDKVVDAVMNQFGIIRAADLNELFNTAKGFEYFSAPKGNRVAIITNAGGPAILAVDALEKRQLVLASFTNETKKQLKEIVHREGSVENPVDLLPGGTAEVYKRVVETVINDYNIDAVISIFVEPVMVQPLPVIEAVYQIHSEKPILQVCMPLPEFWNDYRQNSKIKKPVFRNPEDTVEVISNMLFLKESGERNKNDLNERLNKSSSPKKFSFNPGYLLPEEIDQLAAEYNLPLVHNFMFTEDELYRLEEIYKLKYPLVLKGISKDVVHKSEFEAVKLNIKSKEELITAVEDMIQNFKRNNFSVEGFLLQPYLKTKHELLLGGFRDQSFGPMIMFGSGGKYVEVINDTRIKSAHLSNYDVEDLIHQTKIGKILGGVRGEKAIDIEMLNRIIKSAAQMILDYDEISEFDINPLVIDENDSFSAVDVRIKII